MKHALWHFVRANRRHVGEMLLASLLVNTFVLALPLFSMLVYDKAMGNELHDTLWALSGGMLILFGLEISLRLSRVLIVEHAGARWDAHLDERLMRGILAAPMSKTLAIGDVLSRYREVTGTRDLLSAQFLLPIADLPFLLLFVLAVSIIAGPLVCVPLGVGAVLLVVTAVFQSVSMSRQRRASASQSAKLTWLVDVLCARESLMSKSAADVAATRYRLPALAGARAAAQARLWSQLSQQAVPVAMSFSTVLLLVLGVFRVEAQALSVGGLISVSLLSSRILATLCSIAPIVSRWKEFSRSLGELGATVDFDVAPVSALQAAAGALATEGIRLDSVSFAYPGQARSILDGLTLHLRPGELVAVVGASGAGKSTLLRVLAGHVPHSAGQLAFGGHVIGDDLQRRWLCSQVRFKPQDPSFLRGRLGEVVAPGTATASDAALVRALRSAGFGPSLDRGELGLNSEVGTNGSALSGGQRQMLALARALYGGDAPPDPAQGSEVILLDEPTLGLDRPAQEQVLRELGPLRAGRCVVVATHAAEVIQCADRVLVLEGGRIVADAPPSRLLGAHAAPPRAAQHATPPLAAVAS
ncbi:MAG: ATP-binding cassette domain-containing protein [Burkholderiales bacterium]|nr:ATP-binding cassette domain-containing protein [Burkholderiales bacterium]